MKKGYCKSVLALSVLAAMSLSANGTEVASNATFESDAIYLDTGVSHGGGILKVAGPGGFLFEQKVAAGSTAIIEMNVLKGLAAEDGSYSYELVLSPALSSTQKEMLADLRELGEESMVEDMRKEGSLPAPISASTGSFSIDQGELVSPYLEETQSKSDQATTGFSDVGVKDFPINDDLIVDGSACIGFDCVNGESFGFDTIRLKENNLRIKAQDTSVGAFPTTDWQLTFNESASGGQGKFSVDDITGGRTPFTLEANAPSHSLYVDDGGRVGFGTSIPVVDLHVKDGDTPTLRLEQDGSSGFAPQTWDVAGNETSFFIRDASNGSTLPFRIRPAAPSNSLVIDPDGDIGVNTLSPGDLSINGENAVMHVRTTDAADGGVLVENASGTVGGRALFEIKNNGAARFDFTDSSASKTWRFANGADRFRIIDMDDAGVVEFDLNSDGDLTITGDFFSTTCTAGNPCAPDYVFEDDYNLLTLNEVQRFIEENGHLPNIPSAEELTGPINISEMQMKLLEKIEELTLYTLDQDAALSEQNKVIAELKDRLAALESS